MIEEQFGYQVRSRLRYSGVDVHGPLPREGLAPATTPTYLEDRRQALLRAPEVTVAVCTRGRAGLLHECLGSLGAQTYPSLKVLVVDNAPTDDPDSVRWPPTWPGISISTMSSSHVPACRRAARSGDRRQSERRDRLARRRRASRPLVGGRARARALIEASPGGRGVRLGHPGPDRNARPSSGSSSPAGTTKAAASNPSSSPPPPSHQSPSLPRPQFGVGGTWPSGARRSMPSVRFNTALGAGTVAMGAEDTAAFSELRMPWGTLSMSRPPWCGTPTEPYARPA